MKSKLRLLGSTRLKSLEESSLLLGDLVLAFGQSQLGFVPSLLLDRFSRCLLLGFLSHRVVSDGGMSFLVNLFDLKLKKINSSTQSFKQCWLVNLQETYGITDYTESDILAKLFFESFFIFTFKVFHVFRYMQSKDVGSEIFKTL